MCVEQFPLRVSKETQNSQFVGPAVGMPERLSHLSEERKSRALSSATKSGDIAHMLPNWVWMAHLFACNQPHGHTVREKLNEPHMFE